MFYDLIFIFIVNKEIQLIKPRTLFSILSFKNKKEKGAVESKTPSILKIENEKCKQDASRIQNMSFRDEITLKRKNLGKNRREIE